MSFHCSGLCPSVIQGMVARVKPESDNQHTKEKSGQRTGLWFPNLALMYGELLNKQINKQDNKWR